MKSQRLLICNSLRMMKALFIYTYFSICTSFQKFLYSLQAHWLCQLFFRRHTSCVCYLVFLILVMSEKSSSRFFPMYTFSSLCSFLLLTFLWNSFLVWYNPSGWFLVVLPVLMECYTGSSCRSKLLQMLPYYFQQFHCFCF